MKILDIRFKNLNSLRGEWHIDLQNSAYINDGIFAITGPTGAGKTTIFDAVCLALYGRTSRLAKINTGTNEIMSKGTAECFAQVTFAADAGVFTCKWEQTRAYRNSRGTLQPVRHEISDEITHTPIETKSGLIPGIVANITGMDFGRFTQAMMLEQGGFDAFLRADKNERAKLLELITGMDLYGNISVHVHQRWKSEQTELANIEASIAQETARNTFGDEGTTRTELEDNIRQKKKLEAIHQKTQLAFDWRKEIHGLEVQIIQTHENLSAHQKRIEEFESRRQELESAERAESIRADYVRLEQSRKSFIQAQENFRRIKSQIQECESKISLITSQTLPELMQRRENMTRGITEAPDVILQNIDLSLDNYVRAMKTKSDLEKSVRDSEIAYRQSQHALSLSEAAKDICMTRKNEAQEKHSKALDLIMKLQTRTKEAVLDEQRSILKEGQPCPLCGSPEHPGITHTHSAGENADELFRQKEKLEHELEHLKTVYDKASGDYEMAAENFNQAQLKEINSKQEFEHRTEELETQREECIRLRETVSEAIRPLGISQTDNTCSNIKLQARQWAEEIKRIDDEIKRAGDLKNKLEGSLESARNSLEVSDNSLEISRIELEDSEQAFSIKLSEQNFTDENIFMRALRERDVLLRMQEERRRLDQKMNEIQAVYENLKKEYSARLSMNITERTLEETEREYKEEDAKIKSIIGKISELTEKLRNIQTLNASIKELEDKRDSQKRKLEQWKKLRDLIGSADGDKFRVFAQKITLGLVVKNANDYLRKMKGRYELMITPQSNDLELSVRDNEQAGEIRPTKNLSGGERFIISLALALGLSQISGSKARVDSLFLDEGFGSLDEDALNTALEALGEIRREGRMIGIISHVQALKERIAAQINVIPKSEGRSIITGPGCTGK